MKTLSPWPMEITLFADPFQDPMSSTQHGPGTRAALPLPINLLGQHPLPRRETFFFFYNYTPFQTDTQNIRLYLLIIPLCLPRSPHLTETAPSRDRWPSVLTPPNEQPGSLFPQWSYAGVRKSFSARWCSCQCHPNKLR